MWTVDGVRSLLGLCLLLLGGVVAISTVGGTHAAEGAASHTELAMHAAHPGCRAVHAAAAPPGGVVGGACSLAHRVIPQLPITWCLRQVLVVVPNLVMTVLQSTPGLCSISVLRPTPARLSAGIWFSMLRYSGVNAWLSHVWQSAGPVGH